MSRPHYLNSWKSSYLYVCLFHIFIIFARRPPPPSLNCVEYTHLINAISLHMGPSLQQKSAILMKFSRKINSTLNRNNNQRNINTKFPLPRTDDDTRIYECVFHIFRMVWTPMCVCVFAGDKLRKFLQYIRPIIFTAIVIART